MHVNSLLCWEKELKVLIYSFLYLDLIPCETQSPCLNGGVCEKMVPVVTRVHACSSNYLGINARQWSIAVTLIHAKMMERARLVLYAFYHISLNILALASISASTCFLPQLTKFGRSRIGACLKVLNGRAIVPTFCCHCSRTQPSSTST